MVAVARGVVKKRVPTDALVVVLSVVRQRLITNGRIVDITDNAIKRFKPNGRVLNAGRKAEEGIVAFRCVFSGIASVRRWEDSKAFGVGKNAKNANSASAG